MTTLREAAQQALEALQAVVGYQAPEQYVERELALRKARASITALRAALAEPAQERHFCDRCGKRLSVAGVHTCTPPQRAALAEPAQEPVAWHYTSNAGASVMHWGPSNRLDADMRAAKDYPHVHKVTPLYTAPPQRKPLTDEEILECWKQAYEPGRREHDNAARMARAIEQAHGITGPEDKGG